MNIPWRDDDQFDTAATAGEGQVTILDGYCFAISAASGDIIPGKAMGVFVSDTRYLSQCQLRINNADLFVIDSETPTPFSAVHRLIAEVADAEGTITQVGVERRRYVGNGMREDVILRSAALQPIDLEVRLNLATDFADPFLVRQSRAPGFHDEVRIVRSVDRLEFHGAMNGNRSTRVTCSREAEFRSDGVYFNFTLQPGEEWLTSIQLTPVMNEEELNPDHPLALPVEQSLPAQRLASWRQDTAMLSSHHDNLVDLVARSSADLAALRIPDPDVPGRYLIAAGAPWYMTLFGRDSLLTAYAALPVAPDLAFGVLHALGRLQGKEHNPSSEEQPGRILHEVRTGSGSSLSLNKAYRYFGSIDSSPLYVMLLGEARRWGLSLDEVQGLLPYADRALEWCENFGDRDGDGFMEYIRSGDSGLVNQGWKDSSNCMAFADGTMAEGPIALSEVQAYWYGAYMARAELAEEFGDETRAKDCREKAAALKDRFNRDFWMEDKGFFAMALDGKKQQIDSTSTNVGHCLWTGIVDADKAARVAETLLSPAMFSGWGIRTMGSDMAGYDPLAYHNGAIWPHDNAIVAAGLMRYGFIEESQRVIQAIVDAGTAFGGRLPEIYGGKDRGDETRPEDYPTTCSPQAWAAATPWWMLRTLLRLDVHAGDKRVWCDPRLPQNFGDLRVVKIAFAGHRVTIDIAEGETWVTNLPEDFELVHDAPIRQVVS